MFLAFKELKYSKAKFGLIITVIFLISYLVYFLTSLANGLATSYTNAIFEMLIWLFITGTVLSGFQTDIIRIFIFAIAFAVGNYVGSWMEDRLAFGLCSVQVIVPECKISQDLADKLREHSFAVTIIKGKGKDGDREIMFLHIRRKRISQAVEIIKANLKNAVIIVNDSKVLYGGFIRK